MVRTDVTALNPRRRPGDPLGGVDKRAARRRRAVDLRRQCNVLLPRSPASSCRRKPPIPGHRTVIDRWPRRAAAGIAAASRRLDTVAARDRGRHAVHQRGLDRSLLACATDGSTRSDPDRRAAEPLVCALARRRGSGPPRRRLARPASSKAESLLTDDGLRLAWIEEAELRAIDPELRRC